MFRRAIPAITVAAVVAAIMIAASIGAQRTASRRSAAGQGAGTPGRRTQAAATLSGALPKADPNRAPQTAVDDALFVTEEFFGSNATVPRPYSAALERLSTLLGQYPLDAELHLRAAGLAEKTGEFDRSVAEMVKYADLKKRSSDSLFKLAEFYHNRARFADEVRTLQDLAKSVPVAERGPIYKRAAEVVRSHALKDFKAADFFAELVAADSTNIEPVRQYLLELIAAKRDKDALEVLNSFQSKFPSDLAYFLKTKSKILESEGKRREAEDVYSSVFSPVWPRAIAADYYDLLRRFGRYRPVRRGLQERVRSQAADLPTVGRLFRIYVYEGNYEQASRLLSDLESRRSRGAASSAQPAASGASPVVARAGAWPVSELETVAEMFTSIGNFDQASRYLYTLYLTGGLTPGSPEREKALYRLFGVMVDAAGAPTRVASGDLSFYRDVAEIDRHPGFLNGVLSLILSGSSPDTEFATEEKAAASYFNRAFSYRIFTAFKQEYPQSSYLGDMYLRVVNVFAALDEHRLAVAAAREFRLRFPNSPRFVDVSLRMADSYVALKDRTNERAILLGLLDRLAASQPKGMPLIPGTSKTWEYKGEHPSSEEDADSGHGKSIGDAEDSEAESDSQKTDDKTAPTYDSVLERYVSSLAAETDPKTTETAAFFWGQIKNHPGEEGLYERFLTWLSNAGLVEDQLKAYNAAIRRFDSDTWVHSLARWYIRQKRGRELAQYSRRLMDIFRDDELNDYLLEFAGYGNQTEGDHLANSSRLAFDMYSYAHKRFPGNTAFVWGMLKYLDMDQEPLWEQLSAEYYFADPAIRDGYLNWLARNGKLRERYLVAAAKVPPSVSSAAPVSTSVAAGASSIISAPRVSEPQANGLGLTTYRIFAADAARHLSYFDKAVDAYRGLTAAYPGEPEYAERLADLTRSYGEQDPRFYDEAGRTLSRMAELHPTEHEYRIKAGEAYAERGDFKLAGEQWDKLVQLEPGKADTYLEVATVYWDYYQFDQAVQVFKELRQTGGDQTIYAYRLGAVYEGKADMDSAIAEYMHVLSEPGDDRDTTTQRLAQLARRPGMADKIAAIYNREHESRPADWQLVIGYALYKVKREHQSEALATLRTEIQKSNDIAFLETMRDLFREILRPEDEQQTITRLGSAARDEREAMMYNLQLASFLEVHGQVDNAISLIDKLVAAHPTNVGIVEESVAFYWRAGLFDRALDLYKRTLAQAQGVNRRRLVLQLAQRQVEAGKAPDAEATLRAYYDENKLDSDVFADLTRTLGIQNKLADLAALYQQALKDVRQSGLTGDDARARIAELRGGMIRTFTDLGKFQDAIDQHIEIINSFPEDEGVLGNAVDYADQHNLLDRLTNYYEKLSREANKNYRWQLVLGRIYEDRNNLPAASDQYRIAVTNEPQRLDIRLTLATTLSRQNRYDEAIVVLREGWTMSGRDPQWLVEIARIQIAQGHRDDAVQTMRQALLSKRNQSAQAQLTIAGQLAGWGLYTEAARVYSDVFTRLPKTLKDESVTPESVGAYVRTLVRAFSVADVYPQLEGMRVQFATIADKSKDSDSYRAKALVSAIDAAMRADFGQGVIDYATASESAALAGEIRNAVAPVDSYSSASVLQRYLGIARGAGLVDLEEQIQVQLKDIAFKERVKPEETSYYAELRSLIAFYNRHAAFARAAEVLAAEYNRDRFKDRFDYANQMAIQYRLAGDQPRELDALRQAYATSSGAVLANDMPWVDRYLKLLYSNGMKDEINRLARTYNTHQLQLINFLIAHNEKEMARTAIANANKPPSWVASRSAEVGLFLGDYSPVTGGYFKSALNFKPIGEMIGKRPDPDQNLTADDWSVGARNYGYWIVLGKGPRAESHRFLAADIERHPATESSYLELAAFYLDQKDTQNATAQLNLAAELSPGNNNVTVMRGEIALARGDGKAAMDAWGSLISGRVSIDDAQLYLSVMNSHDFLREALTPLGNFVVDYANHSSADRGEAGRAEAIKPLVRDIATDGSTSPGMSVFTSDFLQGVLARIPDDTSLGKMLIEEKLLPESTLAGVYRLVHQRLSDTAASVFGTAQYENGFSSGGEFVYPARALEEWRRRLMDYLIRSGSLAEARLLVTTIERQQETLALASEPGKSAGQSSESSTSSRYEWLPLAAALIDLRSGADATQAVTRLRRYCGLDASDDHSGTLSPHCLQAYSLLTAEHRQTEAEALLYDAYRIAARSRSADASTLAGLATLEGRRGHPDEASRLLKTLVERSTNNLTALDLAAATAARIGLYSDAISYRERVAISDPTNAINALELARALSAAGRNGDAVDRIAALIGERTAPNRIRAEAAEVAGDIARADRQQATRAAQVFASRASQGDAASALARAAVAEAAGNQNDATAALAVVRGGSLEAVAQLKLGTLALAAGKERDATTAFERAVFLDADGIVSNSIAFHVAGPRVQLISIYSRTARELAAIQLVDGPEGRQSSAITAAVRNALGGTPDREAPATLVFEPSPAADQSKAGLATVAELNRDAATRIESDLTVALVQAALGLGEYYKAIALEGLREKQATRPEDKAAVAKKLAEIRAAQAKQPAPATSFRVGVSNTTPAIYASR